MINFSQKLRTTGNNLTDKLRGFETKYDYTFPEPKEEKKDPIVEHIKSMKEKGHTAEKIHKGMKVMIDEAFK